jgi:hypothetical protein
MKKRKVIYEHMLKFGHSSISPFPQNLYLDRIQVHNMRDKEAQNINEDKKNTDEEQGTLDEGIEVDIMFNEDFKDYWHKLMENASKPMYGTCELSH